MGDPRKFKNKYESPKKVWDAQRIRTESRLKRIYGLKNSREVWVTLHLLKRARRNAMKYLSLGEEGEKKASPLIKKLAKLGIVSENAKLDDILSLSVENFLDRRLQTIVFKKGLARTIKQARQLITHGFIAINGKKVTVPSYMVSSAEEKQIGYYKPIDISVQENKQPKAEAA